MSIFNSNNDDWQGGYKYFTAEEMACKCGCGLLPKHSFMRWLDEQREEYGAALSVSSGARCKKYNASIGGGPAHPALVAVDLRIYGENARKLVGIGIKNGAMGVGVSQKNPDKSRRFIHFDLLTDSSAAPRPWIWSY